MTVVDATNMLFDWFSEHDSFELEKDFMKIIAVTETPEEDRSAFLCALDGFEQNAFVKSVEYVLRANRDRRARDLSRHSPYNQQHVRQSGRPN
jgi:hypothetical protein